MKIDSTGKARTPPIKSGERSGKAARSGEFAGHLSAGEIRSGVAPAGPVHSVDAVLAIQEVPDAAGEPANARARQWGENTLDQLEQIRLDLLTGAIPKDRLVTLARTIGARKANVTDPRLLSILDDIELRARVEIAKYEPRR